MDLPRPDFPFLDIKEADFGHRCPMPQFNTELEIKGLGFRLEILCGCVNDDFRKHVLNLTVLMKIDIEHNKHGGDLGVSFEETHIYGSYYGLD
ncbi:hypothetical protein AVEN_271705-1 [Araneus ventricosus]|uniref:Uncharacterized protein n=1 Tax=Araneus ventricosus TaxID=182803 RepID=A0A4Y2J1B6_ARAVE|nr:hypothetical protein AVEN_271705-1 [Araneus ventricosus]